MNQYTPHIHHRRSIRLKGYDYSREGLYFITICVHDRACLFGEITNGKMALTDTGKIAGDYWFNIPEHFPHAVLHEFIVMPNHIHGIIELVDNPVGPSHGMADEWPCHGMAPHDTPAIPGNPVRTSHGMSNTMDDGMSNTIPNEISDAEIVRTCHGMSPQSNITGNQVRTCHGMSQQPPPQPTITQFGKPVPGSISVIINQYKSSVKRWCNKNGHSRFQWQSRFYDHIIRDEQSYQRISEYIINNPAKWADDKFYSA